MTSSVDWGLGPGVTQGLRAWKRKEDVGQVEEIGLHSVGKAKYRKDSGRGKS